MLRSASGRRFPGLSPRRGTGLGLCLEETIGIGEPMQISNVCSVVASMMRNTPGHFLGSAYFRPANYYLRPPTYARLFAVFLLCGLALIAGRAADWITYEGHGGPGQGKRIVFLSGDEEYRSEESLPMLAKILAVRHGFTCTVLFAINPADHTIDPVTLTNIPGMDALDRADLCVMALRFRDLPDAQMKHFVEYLQAGKPIIALRTSTHAFQYPPDSTSPYARFDWRDHSWPGGFGQQILGETWVSHHGEHGKESTRGIINPQFSHHPILRGVDDLWCPTDVYTVTHLPADAMVLVRGEVLAGMNPSDPPVTGSKNQPPMPVVWVRDYRLAGGRSGKAVVTTMGAAVDLQNEGLRRLLVNACYWTTGLAERLPAKADVTYIGEYHPTWFGFGKYVNGVRPDDLRLR